MKSKKGVVKKHNQYESYKTKPSSLFTIDSQILSKSVNTKDIDDMVEYCVINGDNTEEYIYAISLKEVSNNFLVFCNDSSLSNSLFSILKMLLPREIWPSIIQINSKSNLSQVQKVKKLLKKSFNGVIIMDSSKLGLINLKEYKFTFICNLENDNISKISNKIRADSIKYKRFINLIRSPIMGGKRYELDRFILAQSRSRVAVCKKLYLSQLNKKNQIDASQDDNFEKALMNKLKVLLNMPLEKKGSDDSTVNPIPQGPVESGKTIRKKMNILGMIDENISSLSTSKEGRDLARTRWLDGRNGEEFGAPWKIERWGASFDDISNNVQEIVSECKTYITNKLNENLKPNKGRFSEVEIITERTKMILMKNCRVVGFDWRPSSTSSDEWGGSYGKSCAHNEICMQFVRPFFPQEVVNTRICSECRPAPGVSKGSHGCLEFLISQCKFFKKPMTVWDNEAFHYIDSLGNHFSVDKKRLLHLSEPKLNCYVINLRNLTIDSKGEKSPLVLFNTIVDLLSIAFNKYILFPHSKKLSDSKTHRLPANIQLNIISYLLIKIPNASCFLNVSGKFSKNCHEVVNSNSNKGNIFKSKQKPLNGTTKNLSASGNFLESNKKKRKRF